MADSCSAATRTRPRSVEPEGLPPGFQIADLPLDLDVLRALTDEVAAHFPVLRSAAVAIHRGGLPTMTPDGHPVLGPVPGLEGLYIASGCCVGGLSLSPSAGRALADLVLDGKSEPRSRLPVCRTLSWLGGAPDRARCEMRGALRAQVHEVARRLTGSSNPFPSPS